MAQDSRMVSEFDGKPRLIVGIDYGTTSTFVAWAEFTHGRDSLHPLDIRVAHRSIRFFKNWSAPVHTDSGFVPSDILYEKDELPAALISWGHDAQNNYSEDYHALVSCAKLLLHECEETKDEYKRLSDLQQQLGRDFVKDYLSKLNNHISPVLDSSQTTEDNKNLLGRTISYVFGVPAAWSDLEQQEMLQIASSAGFEQKETRTKSAARISRASEPEAMAAEYLSRSRNDLKVGDSFIVCDGGGGTVDLATYRIDSIHPWRLSEACVAEGILAGGIFLDYNFEKLLLEKLSPFDIPKEEMADMIKSAVDTFKTRQKYSINLDNRPWLPVAISGVPANPRHRSKAGYLHLDMKNDIKQKVFDPIIHKIREALERQISASRRNLSALDGPKKSSLCAILFGGGLSTNSYISSELRRSFSGDNTRDPIAFYQVEEPTAAVARGLVLLGCQPDLIRQRRCQLSYGILLEKEWEEKMGDKKALACYNSKYLDTTVYRVIEWFLRKNQVVEEGVPFFAEVARYVKNTRTAKNKWEFRFTQEVYVSNHVDTWDEPRSVWSQVKDLCTRHYFDIDLRNLSVKRFERNELRMNVTKTFPGMKETSSSRKLVPVYTIPYTIYAKVQDGMLRWYTEVFLINPTEILEIELDRMHLDAQNTQQRTLGTITTRHSRGLKRPISMIGPGNNKSNGFDGHTLEAESSSSHPTPGFDLVTASQSTTAASTSTLQTSDRRSPTIPRFGNRDEDFDRAAYEDPELDIVFDHQFQEPNDVSSDGDVDAEVRSLTAGSRFVLKERVTSTGTLDHEERSSSPEESELSRQISLSRFPISGPSSRTSGTRPTNNEMSSRRTQKSSATQVPPTKQKKDPKTSRPKSSSKTPQNHGNQTTLQHYKRKKPGIVAPPSSSRVDIFDVEESPAEGSRSSKKRARRKHDADVSDARLRRTTR